MTTLKGRKTRILENRMKAKLKARIAGNYKG